MKRYINSIYQFMTMDNSHEEDNDVFEYASEPVADAYLKWIAFASIAAILLLSVMK